MCVFVCEVVCACARVCLRVRVCVCVCAWVGECASVYCMFVCEVVCAYARVCVRVCTACLYVNGGVSKNMFMCGCYILLVACPLISAKDKDVALAFSTGQSALLLVSGAWTTPTLGVFVLSRGY